MRQFNLHLQRLRPSTLETLERSGNFTKNCKEICFLIKTLKIYLNIYQLLYYDSKFAIVLSNPAF